jgi:hypothetical protein
MTPYISYLYISTQCLLCQAFFILLDKFFCLQHTNEKNEKENEKNGNADVPAHVAHYSLLANQVE